MARRDDSETQRKKDRRKRGGKHREKEANLKRGRKDDVGRREERNQVCF